MTSQLNALIARELDETRCARFARHDLPRAEPKPGLGTRLSGLVDRLRAARSSREQARA